MHKRGQAEVMELKKLIDIILGILVAATIILAAVSWNNVFNINKVYLQNDLALASNAVLSCPGNIRVHYPLSPDYKIEMKDAIKVVHEPTLTGTFERNDLILQAGKDSHNMAVGREE